MTKRFIAYDFETQEATAHPTRKAAQKAINASTGRIPGVGWDRNHYRSAGIDVVVDEKAERAGRELFAIVFEDFPLARKLVEDGYGLDFVDWDAPAA